MRRRRETAQRLQERNTAEGASRERVEGDKKVERREGVYTMPQRDHQQVARQTTWHF